MNRKKDNNSSNRSVFICQQCGKYSIINLENVQICSCKTLLKFRGEKLDNANEVINCKLCHQIARQN